MSKNVIPENLAQQLTEIPRAMEQISVPNGETVIMARMIEGVTPEKIKQACSKNLLDGWQLFPLKNTSDEFAELDMGVKTSLPISPFREAQAILSPRMFGALLKRELLRVARSGSSLSLICAQLINRHTLCVELGETALSTLDALLVEVLVNKMEDCDSLGMIKSGQLLCCLPGFGQLASRAFSEAVQNEFMEQANKKIAKEELQKNIYIGCAFGIVNLIQGETCSVKTLLTRARLSIEFALHKDGTNIHQETTQTPLDNATLVHSSEKQFLFFGGERP